MRARLIFPEVEREPGGKPERCEGCGGGAFVRFGKVERAVRDIRVERVIRQRWRCKVCGKVTSAYPVGVLLKAWQRVPSGRDEGFERGVACAWAFLRERIQGS